MKNTKRLDVRVHELCPHLSRSWIQEYIEQGCVSVDGKVIVKTSYAVHDEQDIQITIPEQKYVSRSGYKLEQALQEFNLDVTGLVAMDAGLSTGGFTDCLLQRGIAKVYGIDVGTAQVHEKIKQDTRVVVHEQTDIREIIGLVPMVDLVTLDLSFISVLKVIDVVAQVMQKNAKLLVLIKPQFEVGKKYVGRSGVVKNEKVKDQTVQAVVEGICAYGFMHQKTIQARLHGADGNKELLALFVKQ